jgi:hypothetical protein
MDVIIAIFNQIFSSIKQFISAVTPMAIYISVTITPILKGFFIYLASIDYGGIFNSIIFRIILISILVYIFGYLYLKIYKPELYEKILDALGLKNRLIKQPFLFETDIDFKISSN